MSDLNPSQRNEAQEPAEHDMRRQPPIDYSKRLKDRILWREWFTGGFMIAVAVGAVVGGLKLAGVW